MPSVTLKSSDSKVFVVDESIARKSVTLDTMLKDLGFNEEHEDEAIPINNVSGKTLALIITWAEKHVGDKPIEENATVIDLQALVTDWDREFLAKLDNSTLFDLLTAGNFLDMKLFMAGICQAISKQLVDKSPAEVRLAFGIENDFTPEEEERIRLENEWIEPRESTVAEAKKEPEEEPKEAEVAEN